MYNKIMLVGVVGSDVKMTESGDSPRATLSVATWESKRGKDGEWRKETTWHQISVWGKAVDSLRSISKGDLVMVEGKLSVRDSKDETNEIRRNFFINGYVRLLRKKDHGGTAAQDARPVHTESNDPAPASPSVDSYEDLPF